MIEALTCVAFLLAVAALALEVSCRKQEFDSLAATQASEENDQ